MTIELHSNILRRHRHLSGTEEKVCEWPECDEGGNCRAPKSPENLKSYRWFCKEHAREYNRTWNYYAGMSDEEVEADRRRDTVWRRQTWQIGSENFLGAEHGGFDPSKLNDPFGIFDEQDAQHKDTDHSTIPNATIAQRKALAVFCIDGSVTADSVKQRYKELVKRYHPDAIAGEETAEKQKSEEKIKEVNEAYRVLLDFLTP
jgi:DnaJ-domain-containing protein 1